MVKKVVEKVGLRIIEPKRHAKTGELYHNCPDTGGNIDIGDCKGCPFFVSAEQLNVKYRLHCDRPIEGYPLRVFEPPRAYSTYKGLTGNLLFTSFEHQILEPKLDGVRCIVHITPDIVYLTTRRKNKQGEYTQFQDNVPHLRDHKKLLAIGKKGYSILDSEIIMPVSDDTLALTMGVVGSLPERAISHQKEHGKAYLSVFDVVQWKGDDIANLLEFDERRLMLKKILPTGRYIQLTPSGYIEDIEKRERVANQMVEKYGYEGVVLKNANAGYFDSRAWLKWKESTTIDAIVTGWEKGKAGGRYANTLGALKLSVIDHKTGQMREIARSIPGDDATRDKWYHAIKDLSPLEILAQQEIVELEGQTWTKDGRMRHPRVLGGRNDRSEPNMMDFTGKYPRLV